MSTAAQRFLAEEERKKKKGTDTMSRITERASKFKNYQTLTGRQPDGSSPADHKNAPVIQSDLARKSLKPERTPTVPQQIVVDPGEDISYRTEKYKGGGRTPSAPSVAQTVAPAADPTLESETSGAPRTAPRIPTGSGGQKQGTGKILLTDKYNPEGEIIGDLSGFRQRQAQARSNPASQAEQRFRNAVQPGGRGRSARNPGITVQQPDRQPTVQEEIGPLNTLSDYIKEGAKLKARKTLAGIEKTKSDIQRARDLTEEARDRTDLDRQKLSVDASSTEAANEERRARADTLEQEGRLNRHKADLQQQLLDAETPEERQQIAQTLQQLEAYKPQNERNMGMTENQRIDALMEGRKMFNEAVTAQGYEGTFEDWVKTEAPYLQPYIGSTVAEDSEAPPLPPRGSEIADGIYTAPNGKRVEVKGGKYREVTQ